MVNQSSPSTSQGPTVASPSGFFHPSLKTKLVVGLLFTISVAYNVSLSRSLSEMNGLRSQEFGVTDSSNSIIDPGYIAADIEQYMIDNAEDLGYTTTDLTVARACDVWKDPSYSNKENYIQLQSYKHDLLEYIEAVEQFSSALDLSIAMRSSGLKNWPDVCRSLRVVPDGIEKIFTSKQLSYMKKHGFIEPLITPMRHPELCNSPNVNTAMRIDYIIHDFEKMCLTLKPHSRKVLIDMGASLLTHDTDKHKDPKLPIVSLIETYNKFGFKFDHIYGFESTPINAQKFYNNLLPEEYFPSYHWINTAVTGGRHKMNPFGSFLREYNEDDLIVVKLDIDASIIEARLAQQLLEDEDMLRLVDQFYFEHHVNVAEMEKFWGNTMKGTIEDSFSLMQRLRKKGIAAHFWV